jgi:hypothetical protein
VDVPADREVESFLVALHHPGQGLTASALPWRSFAGHIVLPQGSMLASRVTRQDFERALEKPTRVEEEMGETVLSWERDKWYLEVACHADGTPLYLTVERND